MASVLRFLLLATIKLFGMVFYRCERQLIGEHPEVWHDLRLGMLLNHTSLYEPIFSAMIPWSGVWRIAAHGAFPVADITLDKPVTGRIIKAMAPHVVRITRKRDESWTQFLDTIESDTFILITPEGRMKRKNGLDKHGKPMTVRGGVADVLSQLPDEARIVIAYSGGLHHVKDPDRGLLKIFKTLRCNFEFSTVGELRQAVGHLDDPRRFKVNVAAALEKRRDHYCPLDPAIVRS